MNGSTVKRVPAASRLALCAALALFPLQSRAQVNTSACGPLANGYGPYDYRSDRDKLGIVEGSHFPPVVESLIRGNRGSLGGDLDYTLRAFPNHHRALISVKRYGEKLKTPQPRDLRYSVECYFDRALRFQPDDTTVRIIYAQFLSNGQRSPEALNQLAAAASSANDNPFTHYNIGLVYLEMNEYAKALTQAHKAHALGFTRPELRERLAAAGKWVDAEAAPPASDTASSDKPKN